jgi:tripeptide aminopeptidase
MTDITRRTVDEFMRIVQIDSLSLREEKMFDYLRERFAGLPLEIEFLPYTHAAAGMESGNMLVKLRSNSPSPKKSLFFDAHLDTVEPGLGIKPVLDGDVVRSDGTTILGGDDKSGVAAMIVAIEEIIATGMPHGDLMFAFTSAEEIGLAGVTYLDFSKIHADYGYILDSHGSVGGVIIAAPYHNIYDIVVTGRASHAGIEPDKGINSIKIAAKIVSELPQGVINDDTVANVGLIEGGKATNIVAEECRIKGEFRSHNLADIRTLEDLVNTITERYRREAVRIDLTHTEAYKGFHQDMDSDIIRLTDSAVKGIGIEPRYERTGGGSNTNIYNQHGITALTLATGMEAVHSTSEYIRTGDLGNLTRLIVKLAELA